VHAHGVPCLELGQVCPQLALFEKLDRIRHGEEARRALDWMLAEVAGLARFT
jgi:hypothetical protein